VDFYQIKERSTKNGVLEIYPDFKVCRSKDLMVRGKSFYAVWDEEKNLWSTDEYDVQRLVDEELLKHKEMSKNEGIISVKLMSDYSTKSWVEFRNYVSHVSDNNHQLDENLTFSNTEVKKKDYVSRRLPYPLEKGRYDAFDELIGTLYDKDQRDKLEWAIGAIISGDAKSIQKFIVLYGEAGAGKSTILNIIQKLFDGYYTTFEAKALTASGNAFATEVFKTNPLVAIQHDGDLSKIEDNTKLNSIVSHEDMTMNEKFKPSYMSRVNCFLFMGTNRPVKITDAKSGIIRRLIDVKPSGRKLPPKRYHELMAQIEFELGAIAYHCLEVYREMGKNYYAGYRPLEMILQTDVFFNFVESNYHVFREQEGITLTQAYEMYKTYCDEALVEFKTPRHKFREELKNYFGTFADVARVNGQQIRSYYSDFLADKFVSTGEIEKKEEPSPESLALESAQSAFDEMCATCYAQYATSNEIPTMKWDEVKTKLKDINTSRLHYVKVPENHIVIDFDLKDDAGNKSQEKNIEAASKWPSTYTEYSKSGAGLHLHYIYDGDVNRLSRIYSDGIEIKVFTGHSSLRRKLTKCNDLPIVTINSGLPLKGEKMVNFEATTNEKAIRTIIKKNLNKEYHAGTKPSIDFIDKVLNDAYNSGVSYDVTDMRPAILAFGNNSSNQAEYCIKLVSQMKFKSEQKDTSGSSENYSTDDLVFFDVEVFPNLFVVVWKFDGKPCVKMINPTPAEIEKLLSLKLVGFNCRRYDNHIIYARYIGYDNAQLYKLSQRIISDSPNCMFGEAYNLSYTDVYDFASAGNKKSLKKFEIELGIHHQELGLKWDKPVPEKLWTTVADYCINDVVATEATFHHLSGDWTARQILAELSGLTVNDTTNQHSMRIVFGNNKNTQSQLVYTDLSEMFPGYKYEFGKSTYRDINASNPDPKRREVGEGGFVYAEPGMYTNVALLDVASMHPTSMEELNLFGPYTKRFSDLKHGRILIKHQDYKALENILDGKLAPFIPRIESGEITSKDLSNGLKTVINSVYGLTSAKFENPFRDPRNKDNIVAKRGALFMIDLKNAVQEQGFTVAHIKTDSIKIPNATPEIIDFVMKFGEKYGYTFEHEDTYERMCLVNDAVYIAKTQKGEWSATGAQFAQPYVYKTLFSKEPIVFKDMCETKSVTSAIYLDMNENLTQDNHDYHFVGKIGSFCPIKPGHGGGVLLREKDGKYGAVTGTKGYRWLEAEVVNNLDKQDSIDQSYYIRLCDDAIANISKYGDFEWFVSNDSGMPPLYKECPLYPETGCTECSNWTHSGDNICKLGYDCLPF
jgi:energy-coupling factor transporter ATP-binding protein EcfA2